MKKLLICVAIASAVSYGVFEYANGKVEKEIVNGFNSVEGSNLVNKIEKDNVKVNVLSGTVEINDIKMLSDGREYQTNVKVDGIDYLSDTTLFKDNIKVELNDIRVTGEDFVVDVALELLNVNPEEAIFTANIDTKNIKTNTNFDQVYKVNLKNLDNTYQFLNNEISNLIRGKSDTLPNLKIVGHLSNVKIANVNAKYEGSKFVGEIINDALESSGASKEMFNDMLKGTLSTENYTPIINFIDGKTNKVVINLSNEKDIRIIDIAKVTAFGGSPLSVIIDKYKLKVTN